MNISAVSPINSWNIKIMNIFVVIDGGWSNWSAYGDCSVTCGTGSYTRNRECNSPEPSNGGSTCAGDTSETRECDEVGCPGISCLAHLMY